MNKKAIIDAYCHIRTIDQTIPDNVLDFMKESALKALENEIVNPFKLLSIYTGYKKMDKSIIPTEDDIKQGALVEYITGWLETIAGHIRFFDKRADGSMEWTAGSSDDVTDIVECWYKRIQQ